MGGIAVDARGRTSIDGLWAGGEVSCTGAHGANRLASNSLLEAVVYAARIAEDIDGRVFTAQALPSLEVPRNCAMPPSAEASLRALMTSHVGVIRDGDDLADAIRTLAMMESSVGNIALRNMATTALIVATAAWSRRESRGSHCRSDYPAENALAQAHHDDAGASARGRSFARRGRARAPLRHRLTAAMVTPASVLHPDAFLSPMAVENAVRQALDEDLGRAGDITSIATIPEAAQTRATLVARQAGVIAGLPLAVETFRQLSADIRIETNARDGIDVAKGMQILTITGPARAVLSGERTALNFVGRLSGVATLTAAYVKQTAGTKMRICCTRKTTPGLRALEKYAVRCGGGFNHRFGLDDAILIKDNHIAVAGGVRPVLERARGHAGHLVKIEIEVDTLDQLREVLDTKLADVVLLDNMDIPTLKQAVAIAQGRVVLEVSGGVTESSIAAIAATGVDYASSGALTHSAPNFDVALDIGIANSE